MTLILRLNNENNLKDSKSLKKEIKTGDRFAGKVLSKSGDEVKIKTLDGSIIEGFLEDLSSLEEGKLVRFKIGSLKDGKLKLKVLYKDKGKEGKLEDSIRNIILKEGLSDEDEDLIKNMIKRNLPINKKNILQIKGIFNFKEKLNLEKNKMTEFINKYTESKNLDLNSSEGKNVNTILKNFLTSFKNMSNDDLFLFIENNIDLNSENIESFNSLFKDDKSLFSKVKSKEDSLDKSLNNIEVDYLDENSNDKSDIKSEKDIELKNHILDEKAEDLNKDLKSDISKLYKNNDKSLIDVLKNIANENGSKEITKEIKSLVLENSSNLEKGELSSFISNLDNINDDELINILTNKDKNNLKKNEWVKVLKDFFSKEENLQNSKTTKIKDLIFEKLDSNSFSLNEEENNLIEEGKNKADLKNKVFSKEENIKNDINEKIEEVKNNIKKALGGLEGGKEEKIIALIKENINDVKLYNDISNEYYYLDIPVKREEREYPCKLIIKDDRKDGKKIDKTNVKLVLTVKTVNMGSIDSFLAIDNKNLNLDIKCEEEYIKKIDKNKKSLLEGLKGIGFLPKINILKKEDEVSISNCRDFFANENNSTLDIMV